MMHKTELCRHTLEKRKCPYGDACLFAHSREELRDPTRDPRYHKKICSLFLHGRCHFGKHCFYRHHLISKDLDRGMEHYILYALSYDVFINPQIFKELIDLSEPKNKETNRKYDEMVDWIVENLL